MGTVVFLINSDTKSQKGDSESAAAANILSEKILNPAAKEEEEKLIGAENKKDTYQNTKDAETDENGEKVPSIPQKNNEKETKKFSKLSAAVCDCISAAAAKTIYLFCELF